MQLNTALVLVLAQVPADRTAGLGLLGLLLVERDDLRVNLARTPGRRRPKPRAASSSPLFERELTD